MSIRRIGARAALVAVGVLVSVALMVSPSSAANGGNSANAARCEQEYGVLVAQDGSTFKNAGACTSYAAKGGVLGVPWHLTSVSPTFACPGTTIKFTGVNFRGTEAVVQWYNPAASPSQLSTTAKVLSSTMAEAPAPSFGTSGVGTVNINNSNTVAFTFSALYVCFF